MVDGASDSEWSLEGSRVKGQGLNNYYREYGKTSTSFVMPANILGKYARPSTHIGTRWEFVPECIRDVMFPLMIPKNTTSYAETARIYEDEMNPDAILYRGCYYRHDKQRKYTAQFNQTDPFPNIQLGISSDFKVAGLLARLPYVDARLLHYMGPANWLHEMIRDDPGFPKAHAWVDLMRQGGHFKRMYEAPDSEPAYQWIGFFTNGEIPLNVPGHDPIISRYADCLSRLRSATNSTIATISRDCMDAVLDSMALFTQSFTEATQKHMEDTLLALIRATRDSRNKFGVPGRPSGFQRHPPSMLVHPSYGRVNVDDVGTLDEVTKRVKRAFLYHFLVLPELERVKRTGGAERQVEAQRSALESTESQLEDLRRRRLAPRTPSPAAVDSSDFMSDASHSPFSASPFSVASPMSSSSSLSVASPMSSASSSRSRALEF